MDDPNTTNFLFHKFFFKIAIGLGIILFGNFGANQLALALEHIDIAASEQDVTIWGADSDDSLTNIHPTGIATGDFNDDGIQDILIGTQLADGPNNTRSRAGEAYIIFGKTGLSMGTDYDLAFDDHDIIIYGAASFYPYSGDFLGLSVAGGDVNGDGVDAIIEEIEELVNSGAVNQGQGNALIAKLQAACCRVKRV